MEVQRIYDNSLIIIIIIIIMIYTVYHILNTWILKKLGSTIVSSKESTFL